MAAENLALKAEISADSEFNGQYKAQFVADGIIPELGLRTGADQEWAVNGATHKNGASIIFRWEQPVDIAELIYYGRTSFVVECWKDYELYLDDEKTPILAGQLTPGHGPQRITLKKPEHAKKITLKFTSAHFGMNPGASEIQIYSVSPSDDVIGSFEELPPYKQGDPQVISRVKESHALADKLYSGDLGFEKLLLVQRHEYNISHVYTYHAEGFVPGGGIFIFTPGSDGKLERIFDSGKGEVMDVRLSYNADKILFSYKQTDISPSGQDGRNKTVGPDKNIETKYQIYQMNIDGSELKQLTDDLSNNFNPCWLPDGRIVFLSDRKESFAYCFVTTSPLLYRMDADGSNIVKLSHGYLNDFTPSILNDGRIIYSRWEYVDRPAIPIQSLWTLKPDGTDVEGYFGNRVLDPGTFMEARSIGSTRKVLCVLTAHNGSCRGAIGIIDPDYGANAQQAITNITPEIYIGKVDRGNGNILVNKGPYENPFPLDEEYFLVSSRGTVILRDYDGTAKATLIGPKDGMGFYSPQPIRRVSRPPIISSILPDNAKPWATVLIQDVYNGLDPEVKRGQIKKICVVEEIEKSNWAPIVNEVPTCSQYSANSAFGYLFPTVSCGATYAPKKIWGYAPVEEDGSANFKVPSGLPIYFLAIDEHGRALQRMRTFTHFQPGEQKGCIGCHADRNYATTSGHSARPTAALKPEQQLTVPEWGRRNFDYSTIVQPVLDQYCVGCHNSREMPKDVDLSGDKTDFFNVSYEILARKGTIGEKHPEYHGVNSLADVGENPYTKWMSSINGAEANVLMIKPLTWGSPASKLAKMVLSGHPDENGDKRFEMDENSRRRLMAWMDLNVPYYDSSDSNYHYRMGCRRMLPPELAGVIEDVRKRRCASCHDSVPRKFYTRVTNIEENSFLLAPLAKLAGGTEVCGQAVFKSRNDPDYQAIIKAFDPITEMLKEKPRLDMVNRKFIPTKEKNEKISHRF